jgi:predicted secreted Zn-dependent protease
VQTGLNTKPLFVLPAEQVHFDYYPIAGSTADELRSQMLERGPVEQLEGRRYDAKTQWTVNWSYQYKKSGDQCAIGSVKGNIATTFILPKWQPPAQAPRSLVAEWRQYSAALQIHENGHKNHGIAAGKDILHALSSLPSYSNCHDLDQAVQATTQKIIKTYNQQDIAYDRQTRHGSTQGAIFPVVTALQPPSSWD